MHYLLRPLNLVNLILSVFFRVSINMLKGFDVSQPDESKRNERGKMCDFSKTEKDEGIGFTAIHSENGFKTCIILVS